MTVKVVVNKSQLDYFRKIARNSFPLECQAYLLGQIVSPTRVIIDSFVYPKYYKLQEKGTVQWTSEEFTELKKKIAIDDKRQIIGDFHTHPSHYPIMSPQDHRGAIIDCLRICGICSVNDKKRTQVVIWTVDSSLPCEILYKK